MRGIQNRLRGIFITFEGVEGAGKTTQIKAIARWLKKWGKKVVVTREPGGTPLADRIRSILLDPKTEGIEPASELFLYEIARADHLSRVILPALKKGAIVLCDRFTDATVAYQGFGRGISLKGIESFNRRATNGLKPDLTFLFDLPVRTGLKRARRRGRGLDRLEREANEFHKRVRNGYLTLARKEKRRFRIIHATRPPREIQTQLRKELEKCGLPLHGA